MNLDQRVERIVYELDDKKAEEIEVFNLDDVEYIAKRVILANALGGKHGMSLVTHLKDKLKPLGEQFLFIDESDDWVVIDMGDILVHIMSSAYRQKYSLEEFLSEISQKKAEGL
ncbi:MAG: ribosome silencing factor [Campylobacterales bacterium]|nr:ribosome silencing factor [Campylobacterales bacterium]